MKIDILRSLIARYLPSHFNWAAGGRWQQRVWRRLYGFYAKGRLPVCLPLHGRSLFLNGGSPYPFIVAQLPGFNSGLVAAVSCLKQSLGRPLRIIDVGSAVGDTVALLVDRVPDCIESCVCIDGAEDSRPLFELNTRGVKGISVFFTMLARHGGVVPSLLRQHPGTAMATGKSFVQSQTLDTIVESLDESKQFDLLKIDLDGYDGDVMLGASLTLARSSPVVVFEWHPQLIRCCGNDCGAPFEALAGAGYRTLLWFSNRGHFSHRTAIPSRSEIDWWSDYLIFKNAAMDPHFDIIALPSSHESLADCIVKTAVYP